MSFANSAITWSTRILPRSLCVSGMPSGTRWIRCGADPLVGARYGSRKPELQNLRSWPVAGFEAIRIYYLPESDAIHVIRILHGKRDVKRILERGNPI